LHQKPPVRVAHRVKELESLVCQRCARLSLRDLYLESTVELVEFPRPRTSEVETRFTQLMEHIKQRHNNVVSILAQGIRELKQTLGANEADSGIQEFLESAYLSRIGIRMLIGQHIGTHCG